MPKAKYYAGIEAARKTMPSGLVGAIEPFDFAVLGSSSPLARFTSGITGKLILPIYALSRRFKPVLPLGGIVHITRAEQVREVLLRWQDFPVPFGAEMGDLGQGAVFMLGQDGEEHDRLLRFLAQLIDPKDAALFARQSGDFAEALLDNSNGRIDVIGDLFKRVAAEIATRWFGLSCDNIDDFGDWTLAVSALLFGDPYGKPETRRMALNGAQRLGVVIDDAMLRTRRHIAAGHISCGEGSTLVERALLLQEEAGLGDAEVRAMLLGTLSGFIPTNTLSAAQMLEVLLDRPEAMAMARDAALRGDREAMRRIVYEAGRLSPALAPGQFRYCPRDTFINVDGREVPIKAGTTLLVSTMSAMRDAREVAEPTRFWPDRTGPDGKWQEPELVFGLGPHVCIGKHLALEQITSLFMALMKRPGLDRASGALGRLQRIGPFPRRLDMTFTTTSSAQSMFLILAPVTSGADKARIDADLARLGHPAHKDVDAALKRTGIVHFASLASIATDQGLRLAWELNVDGPIDAAICAIAAECHALVGPAFSHCGHREEADFAAFMRRHLVTLHGRPWGATGLNYNGTGEFPVESIERQNRFAGFAERAVTDFLSSEAGRGSHAMLAVDHVRRILNHDGLLFRKGTPAQRQLMREAAQQKFDALAMKPSRAKLAMTNFRPVSGKQALLSILRSRDGRMFWVPLLALLIGYGAFFSGLDTPSSSLIWELVTTTVRTVLATLFTIVAALGIFLLALRRSEKRDWIDTSQASVDHIEALGRNEDVPGYAQNHILAVGELKQGLLRVMTNAFALWAIRMLITSKFRPGFVLNMGTIHKARWWRVPGTRTVAFYSNFDGSWESYLEDFITRAHIGQTAAWSNWKGFPPTRWLVFDGAKDGDRFKRWVRTKQQVAPFWYSRFPRLTTDQIRNNALIHAGLARIQSQDEAEEWLRCFGSMPRIENRIESDEVQALVFTGLKRLKFSASLVVEMPPEGRHMGEWLTWIRGEALTLDDPDRAMAEPALNDLVARGVLTPAPIPGTADSYSLVQSLTVTFGDRPIVADAATTGGDPASLDPSDEGMLNQAPPGQPQSPGGRRALFFGCTAAGFAKFTIPNAGIHAVSELFPPAFRIGMARRGRNLGDLGEADSGNWRWGDSIGGPRTAEAVLMVYAEDPADLDFATEVHTRLLEMHGGRLIQRLDCAPPRIDQHESQHDFEHFGYRDGISQPVIKGTNRASQPVPDRDLVEPGEFILGYANGQGYFPPSLKVPAESDTARNLPQLSVEDLSRYPDFDRAKSQQAQRDFGRNGTFLVLRELAQDVSGFEEFTRRKAHEVRTRYQSISKLIGQQPDQDWIKAKLMGRWPNGRPLIGNPVNIPSAGPGSPAEAVSRAAEHENDFAYGADDPQGLACPFASHIRRTNPRDSKQPGDREEQAITNRHRLLRRGRTYDRRAGDGSSEKGILFATLCTDLERQFEFVQQVWINSPGFHGLSNEPDPVTGGDIPDPETGLIAERFFSIPTAAGSIRLTGMQNFVSVKAGGYFFLPSRSALTFLTDVSLRQGAATARRGEMQKSGSSV